MLRLDRGSDPCLASQLRANSEGRSVRVHRVKGSPTPPLREEPLPLLRSHGSHLPHLEATNPLKIWSFRNSSGGRERTAGPRALEDSWRLGEGGPGSHQLGFPRQFPPPPLPAGCLLSAEAAVRIPSSSWGCGQVLPGMRWAPSAPHPSSDWAGPGGARAAGWTGIIYMCVCLPP